MRLNIHNCRVNFGPDEMAYASFGHGENELIILPGLSDGLTTTEGKALPLSWMYREFSDSFTVSVFSRRANLPDHFTIAEMAEDQAAVIRMIGKRSVSVLGVSQGGMIALMLAADHPELVEKLVIAVSAPCVNPLIQANLQRWIGYAEAGDHKQLMIDSAEHMYSESRLRNIRLMYPLLGRIGKPENYRRFLANAHAILNFDGREKAKKITCPVLIIGGESDRTVGFEGSEELHRLIPRSQLYCCRGLGHAAYEEERTFNQRVIRFLKEDH